MASKIEEFYTSLQTLPRLISDLAMSVAQAQTRLDENYVKELAAFTSVILPLLKDGPGKADEYINLFKNIAPSRYQFTETIVEVRADLQMTSATGTDVSGQVGINTPVFAVAVNASYSRRSAQDYRAAALVRTQLNAIPSNQDILTKLLDPKGTPGVQLPDAERYKAIADLIKQLPQTPKLPAGTSPPNRP
ncbi:MAG TPA: hypothetical protein VF591_21865 [Pyrinomonadaceae bacterium]|jgi:hypothetical protein